MNSESRRTSTEVPTLKARGASTDLEPHIRVRNLNAFYGNVQALTSINIEIPRQQVTVIMGPSGCGKTRVPRLYQRS